jgi:hypothetical protein
MGKASSAKKVARVARAGGGSKSSKRGSKPLFPVAIGLIVVLGVSLIVFARSSQDEAAATPPIANQDHWHAAYGVRICGQGFAAPIQVQDDPVGIHTHGDGIMHVHPFTNASSGKNANLGEFFDATGVTIDDDEIDLGGDTKVKEGDDTCGADDKPGIVQVAVWENAREASSTDPEIITDNIRDIRFTNDSMAFTIAFAPEGANIPPPPTVPGLDQLTDVPSSETTPTTLFDPATATSLPAGTEQESVTTTTPATTDTTAVATTDTTAAP